MKKIYVKWLCGIIISAAAISNVQAQVTEQSVSYAAVKNPATAVHNGLTDNSTGNDNSIEAAKARLKELKASFKAIKANAKAQSYFDKEFKGVADAKWTVESEVICAYLKHDEVETRVIFDKRGSWVHTMLYYKADKLDNQIKALVTANYPGYNITGAREIKENNATFYVVYLENDKNYEQVVVKDGEIGTYQKFSKIQ